jgi:glutamate-5-semialdehyde dehydrogenase
MSKEDLHELLLEMGEKARQASYTLTTMPSNIKNECLLAMADAIENAKDEIKEKNNIDLAAGEEKGLSAAMIDRLRLTDERIKAMADGLRVLTALEDPVGKELEASIRPNGLKIEKRSVPIGVIGIIFESRPNVTVDAAGLCFKAGNAVILRGGSEAIHSNKVLAHILNRTLLEKGMPDGIVQLVPFTDRVGVSIMCKLDKHIDLIIPRGGEGLINAVVTQSTIPVIKHYKGVCHQYVDKSADLKMALEIVENSKVQRPGVCNAIETLLIHEDILAEFAPMISKTLKEDGVELRADQKFKDTVNDVSLATEQDWYDEYLDLVIAIKTVGSVEEAITHINQYGSHHSDGIVAEDSTAIERFLNQVDSSTVYHNASTRFTDGSEFGMGCEIGISTDKLHARGPMGLPELTTYKYIVTGNGQIRS